jgi:hypothetical protein
MDRPESDQPSAAVPRAAGPQAEPSTTAPEPVPGSIAYDPSAPVSIVAGPQAESAVTPREAPAVTPGVFDDQQRVLLTAVLNRIIPAHGALPGAGDADVASLIERTLATSVTLRRLFFDGLVEIQLTSARRTGRDFIELDGAQQDALLEEVELDQPAFFAALVDHTCRGYYTLPQVHEVIGFESRPPQPLGHELPPFDPSLLDRQRQRAPFWRRTMRDA